MTNCVKHKSVCNSCVFEITATGQNAARFAYKVYEGFQRKEIILTVAADLKDAYNKAQFKLLKEHFVWYSISLMLTIWLTAAFMENKRLRNSISTTQQLAMGFPHGSPLSPAFYNVYMTGLANLNSNGVSLVLTFAEDWFIYNTVSHHCPEAAGKRVAVMPRDKVWNQSKQVTRPVVHPQQQSIRTGKPSGLLSMQKS